MSIQKKVVIQKVAYTKRITPDADASEITLVGIYQLNLPKLALPKVSRQTPTYVQLIKTFMVNSNLGAITTSGLYVLIAAL